MMFSTLKFPVNLSSTTTTTTTSPSLSSDDNRVNIVGEVDFFSRGNNNSLSSPQHDDDDISVKKEIYDTDAGTSNCNLRDQVNTGLQLLITNAGSDQSTVEDDGASSNAEHKRAKINELEQLQEDLRRMNAENQKLKEMLSHVSSNYTNLQMHLVSLMQQQQNERIESTEHELVVQGKLAEEKEHGVGGGTMPRKLIDLGPNNGTAEVDDQVSNSSSDERTRSSTPQNINKTDHQKDKKLDSDPDHHSELQEWDPSKLQKLNPSNATDQATMRKARVSVRARSEAPMISDGCQWRKYGQKMAKGNPCPRAYYRCTMAVGCPVRKQVQRCAEDRTILITTYEGTHNHPLPPAAMAMASTTAAAASMLLSGSMSSADGNMMNPNLIARAIFPCSSANNMAATLSASAPFPTVTLDLTHNNNNNNALLQHQINPPQGHAPVFQVLGGQAQNFGQLGQQLPQVIAQALYNNQSKFSGLQLSSQDSSLSAAATAAITTDPNFTAALAAAISSIIGGAAHPNNNNSSNPNIINSATINSFSGN